MHTSLKIIGLSALTLALTSTAALAGDGKDCDYKKKAKVKTTSTAVTAASQTTVLSTAERGTLMTNKTKKTHSFEDALKLCRNKSADDLQACIDYKTGVTAAKS
ncbi:hypothetical protein [Hellea balneolensis]|uniref:hypothetical protein n=1 Tax=Hellea balneolensis TaxID=287478 RepID=UPI000417336E|nr:hypothetical protein [Hellea balneolensis]